MTKRIWKDVSSYSRYDKEKKPNVWETKCASVSVVVIWNHVYYPGKWTCHISPWYDTHLLKAKTKEVAQTEALGLLRKEITKISKSIGV